MVALPRPLYINRLEELSYAGTTFHAVEMD